MIEELKFLGNFTKKNFGGGGGGGGWVGGVRVVGGQGGCERKIEVFVKIKKKTIFLGWVGLGGGVSVDVKED